MNMLASIKYLDGKTGYINPDKIINVVFTKTEAILTMDLIGALTVKIKENPLLMILLDNSDIFHTEED